MRRIVALLAVFLAVIGLSATAHAVEHKLVYQELKFHTSLGDAFSYSAGDSSFRLRGTGLQASDEQKDTSAVIDWGDWELPGPLYNTTVAADTMGALLLTLYPDGTSPAVTADSVGFTVQMSLDKGVTWTTCPATGPRIDPDVASMGAAAILEVGSSNAFYFPIRVQLGGAVSGGPFNISNTATPTANQTYGSIIRIIMRGDHTGKYRMRLAGWKHAVGD